MLFLFQSLEMGVDGSGQLLVVLFLSKRRGGGVEDSLRRVQKEPCHV